MKRIIRTHIILVILITCTITICTAADEDANTPEKMIQYRILIRFNNDIGRDHISLFFERFDLKPIKEYSIKNLFLCKMPSASLYSIDELCEHLSEQPEVSYAEKDQKVTIYK